MSENSSPQSELTKEERFKANPDRWVCLDDLIIAVMRTDDGPAMFCSPKSREEVAMVKTECEVVLLRKMFNYEAMRNTNRISHPPKGAIKRFANRIMGR